MAENKKPKAAFAGGGTAGHVYPGFAVIEALQASGQEWDVLWIGRKRGIERSLVQQQGYRYAGISAGKLRRYFSIKNFSDIFKIIKGCFDSFKILKKERPAILFSKGGFVAVPPVIAARLLGIPVFIHESDSSLGLANKICAPFADKIFVAYEETLQKLRPAWRKKAEAAGNPVRKAILAGNRQRGRARYNLKEGQKLVLVLGGSSGAAQLNSLAGELAGELPDSTVLVHQMGQSLYKPAQKPNYIALDYVYEELPDLIAAADLAVSRAGAGAIWEFAALGAPVLFVPLPGHQTASAALLEKRGACLMLSGSQASASELKRQVSLILNDRKKREELSAGIKQIAAFDSASRLADKIKEALL